VYVLIFVHTDEFVVHLNEQGRDALSGSDGESSDEIDEEEFASSTKRAERRSHRVAKRSEILMKTRPGLYLVMKTKVTRRLWHVWTS
jgi:hypothetical protein